MDRQLVVLQHHPRTGPSSFTDVLDARDHLLPWRLLEVDEGRPPPPVDEIGALLVLGGPMGVPDVDEHPWMPTELELLRATVDADVPVLGICLGAQLVATALGGEVTRREVAEIGFVPLTRTEEGRDDDVGAGWPDEAAALMLHQDEVSALPADAVALLDGSDETPAWRVGSAIGVQFHPEVTAEQLEGWLEIESVAKLVAAADVDGEALLEEARGREKFTIAHGRSLLGRWIDNDVRRHLPA